MSPGRTPMSVSEDEIKRVLEGWLRSQGWEARVFRGKHRGIDIQARRGTERWIIEVKGGGPRRQRLPKNFLDGLGQLLQRMEDPEAKYSIGLPDLPGYRGLWQRLPPMAKSRTKITALFAAIDGRVTESDT